MTTDKDRIHRWLTQADLERMLDEARTRALREAASVLWDAYNAEKQTPTFQLPSDLRLLAERIDLMWWKA